jgi:hypothetical protein
MLLEQCDVREKNSMAPALDIELETYEKYRDHLLATAEGKYVLIYKDQVVSTYDTQMDAVAQGYRQFGNVPFLVKKITRVEIPENFVSHLLGV